MQTIPTGRNIKHFSGLVCQLLLAGAALALNPIVPANVYVADPEAHVMPDGEIYVYGSLDENNDYWCSYRHHVLSSSDMLEWSLHRNAFSSKGPNDQINDHDRKLFAPDCAHKNGKYYLYYCSPGRDDMAEGVAVADSPAGPFIHGRPIVGARQIDPAVIVDGDKAWYYWGQGTPKVARLSDDMLSLDTNTIQHCLEGKRSENHFHEGSSIRKIGDTYYLVYADESRRGRPTCLGYATSDAPNGPFKYRGVIIDNFGCDPASWNNHGSIEPYNGQWYVFYHRSTNNSKKFRKACIEPISIQPDGSINEVKMTTQGASPPLDAFLPIEAELACQVAGGAYIADREGVLTNMKNKSTATYRYINFGDGAKSVEMEYRAIDTPGTLFVHLDSIDNPAIARIKIERGQTKATASVKKAAGIHSLHLRYQSEGSLQLDRMQFRR